MNLTVVGTGYVGLVAGVGFASAGHKVICVDRDEKKIALLKEGKIPIYEPGLDDLLRQHRQNITFTTNLGEGVATSNLILVAVGTPEGPDGNADLSATFEVLRSVCQLANEPKFVILKSTVPVGTAEKARQFCRASCEHSIEIISNPEFLREGAAVEDFLNPCRIIVGLKSEEARKWISELYAPWAEKGRPLLVMDNASAELTKYAANAFLSVKISFINELARLADVVGADINEVRRGFTSDHRINPAFFNPGVGFGGSCFPKDVKALIHCGQTQGVPMRIVEAADIANREQKESFLKRVLGHFDSNMYQKKIAVWGIAFKPNTDDIREAPALFLMERLLGYGVSIKAYDPIAMDNAKKVFGTSIEYAQSAEQALTGCDALLVLTEWDEFRSFNLSTLRSLMKSPVVFDGRNIYDPPIMKKLGFVHYSIGRQSTYYVEEPNQGIALMSSEPALAELT